MGYRTDINNEGKYLFVEVQSSCVCTRDERNLAFLNFDSNESLAVENDSVIQNQVQTEDICW